MLGAIAVCYKLSGLVEQDVDTMDILVGITVCYRLSALFELDVDARAVGIAVCYRLLGLVESAINAKDIAIGFGSTGVFKRALPFKDRLNGQVG
jgi:hypothetical protein